MQDPTDSSADIRDSDLTELQEIHSVNRNRELVSKISKTQNPRRQLTRQKKRNNTLRRQRISNRKTATQLRKMKQREKTVKGIGDRFGTEIETTAIDQVCELIYSCTNNYI